MSVKMSPIGIEPKHAWESIRFSEVKSAIQRYVEADFPVPIEWMEEYNGFINRVVR